MSYKVKLEVFEGPLDLLLYLIKKEELNISDIPIARITDQYLEYLELMQMMDLDIAGEFLVMAATLMHIKSKMLLPPDEAAQEEIEEDPRAELVRRLLEYKKFKEAASELAGMEKQHKHLFPRVGTVQMDEAQIQKDMLFEASLFDLITAFTKVLKDIPKDVFHEVVKDEFTVSQKMHDILHMMVEKQSIFFLDLFESAKHKKEMITIFLALLELIRLKAVVIQQAVVFGDIEITRCAEEIKPIGGGNGPRPS
ncbi:MAG: segregation/condensation protein A [Candidatus Omnitrophica bacterium]|nr:segregation/condensation protein A [Candidatus Omnitrophota bacterium]